MPVKGKIKKHVKKAEKVRVTCIGCGKRKDLRFGWCYQCASKNK
jgi:hypothetical protein